MFRLSPSTPHKTEIDNIIHVTSAGFSILLTVSLSICQVDFQSVKRRGTFPLFLSFTYTPTTAMHWMLWRLVL